MRLLLPLLTNAPWWVWLLLAYIFAMGALARRGGPVSLVKLSIPSLAFTAWGLYSLVSRYPIGTGVIAMWSAAALAGGFGGWLWAHSLVLQIDRSRRSVVLPGSWSILIVLLSIFIAKYTLGVISALRPNWVHTPLFTCCDLGVSGSMLGVFWGRLLGIWRQYRSRTQLQG